MKRYIRADTSKRKSKFMPGDKTTRRIVDYLIKTYGDSINKLEKFKIDYKLSYEKGYYFEDTKFRNKVTKKRYGFYSGSVYVRRSRRTIDILDLNFSTLDDDICGFTLQSPFLNGLNFKIRRGQDYWNEYDVPNESKEYETTWSDIEELPKFVDEVDYWMERTNTFLQKHEEEYEEDYSTEKSLKKLIPDTYDVEEAAQSRIQIVEDSIENSLGYRPDFSTFTKPHRYNQEIASDEVVNWYKFKATDSNSGIKITIYMGLLHDEYMDVDEWILYDEKYSVDNTYETVQQFESKYDKLS